MTIKKRVFAIILSITATMCCMLSACKDNGDGSVETQSYTDIDLVQNHDSDYVVVIPAQQDETIEFAASELVTFFEQATEYTLQVKTDESISYNESQKVFLLVFFRYPKRTHLVINPVRFPQRKYGKTLVSSLSYRKIFSTKNGDLKS